MQSDELTRGSSSHVASHPAGAGPDVTDRDHGEGGEHEHVHLPPPSIWPIATAGGIALSGMGLVTSWPISALGLFIMAMAIYNWVQELRHENP